MPADKVPNVRGTIPGPKAQAIIEKDTRYLATSTKTAPIAIESAQGSVVRDVDGNTLLDFASGVAVLNVGHSHPKVVRAVQDQAERFFHFAGTDYYYQVQADLAERLAESMPITGESKVFFSNSGTEAVEAAFKAARYHEPDRKLNLAFIGAFHGRTMGSLSLTASKKVQRENYQPMQPGVVHMPYAYCYRCPYHLEYPSCDIWCARIMKEVYFETILPPGETAAVFMEPVQGEGGYIVPPKEFVQIIAKDAKAEGIIFVDDDVQAGMGRTGRMWGIEHFGVEPDILCAAKSIASGIPMGAMIMREELDFGVRGAHSNTFGGNALACAAANATLDILKEEKLIAQAERKGKWMLKRLREIQEGCQCIGDVRGLGMMAMAEFVEDRETKKPAVKRRDDVQKAALQKGLILISCGRSGLRFIPPLNIEKEHLEKGFDILDEAVREAEG
jgi:4-aminobutyrate aminotransferase